MLVDVPGAPESGAARGIRNRDRTMGACCAAVALLLLTPGLSPSTGAASCRLDECGPGSVDCPVPASPSRACFECSARLRASKTMLNVVVSQERLVCKS